MLVTMITLPIKEHNRWPAPNRPSLLMNGDCATTQTWDGPVSEQPKEVNRECIRVSTRSICITIHTFLLNLINNHDDEYLEIINRMYPLKRITQQKVTVRNKCNCK
jgi:hypothetical protein